MRHSYIIAGRAAPSVARPHVPGAARHGSAHRRPHSVVITECGRRSNQQCRAALRAQARRRGLPASPQNTAQTRLRRVQTLLQLSPRDLPHAGRYSAEHRDHARFSDSCR